MAVRVTASVLPMRQQQPGHAEICVVFLTNTSVAP